jgi:hypothetical protein
MPVRDKKYGSGHTAREQVGLSDETLAMTPVSLSIGEGGLCAQEMRCRHLSRIQSLSQYMAIRLYVKRRNENIVEHALT